LAADHKDEGTEGETDGLQYYHVGSGANGLLWVPDVWGWNGGRTRALADELAKKYKLNVWIPKILQPKFEAGTHDDALPPDFDPAKRFGELFEKGKLAPGGGGEWGPKTVIPKCKTLIDAMKKDGVSKFGLVGVCYGAWIGMHLSKEISGEELVCCATPHPSAFQLESGTGGDPGKLVSEQKCPWAFYPAGDLAGEGADPAAYDDDGDLMKALEKVFPGKNRSLRFKEMKHGFVTRGAIAGGSNVFKAGEGDAVKTACQTCIEDMVDFFSEFGLIDGRVSMKVTTKKSAGLYVKSAKSFFTGIEAKDGTQKPPISDFKVSGLGDAVNVAVSAAAAVEKEGLAVIKKIETSYPLLAGKGQPRIVISLSKK